MFSYHEYRQAFERTRVDHPSISDALGETFMRKFVQRWENNWPKADFRHVSFGELIRLTLNELNIAGKPNRQMYAALVGHYYSRHAAYVNKRKTPVAKRTPQQPVALPPYTVTPEPNGQLAWEI